MRHVAIVLATGWLAALTGCSNLSELNSSDEQAVVMQKAEFSFSADYHQNLVLRGHVPNEGASAYLEELAAALFPDVKLSNRLLTDSESISGWARNTRWGLSSLSRLDKGQLQVEDLSVYLKGSTGKTAVKNSIEAATIGLKAEISHTLNINVDG